jgi:hypothetical protein
MISKSRVVGWVDGVVERHPHVILWLFAVIVVFTFMVAPVFADGLNATAPIKNITPGLNGTVFNPQSIVWSPETGYYTRWWFNDTLPFFDVYGLFYSLFLPMAGQIGWGWMFFVMWGTITTGFYLYTQESTMPFVIGILFGALVSYSMGMEQIFVMIVVMGFLGAGIITKAVLGHR